jgi:hypothetical protein
MCGNGIQWGDVFAVTVVGAVVGPFAMFVETVRHAAILGAVTGVLTYVASPSSLTPPRDRSATENVARGRGRRCLSARRMIVWEYASSDFVGQQELLGGHWQWVRGRAFSVRT